MDSPAKSLMRNHAAVVAAVLAVTIASAWIIELAGYPPCELCLLQRWPYYVGVPLALAAAACRGWIPSGHKVLSGMVVALLMVSAGLGTFHFGVEQAWWEGPTACSTRVDTTNIENLIATLKQVKVVSCTKASFTVVGISLSGWNAILSVLLAGWLAHGVFGLGRRSKSS